MDLRYASAGADPGTIASCAAATCRPGLDLAVRSDEALCVASRGFLASIAGSGPLHIASELEHFGRNQLESLGNARQHAQTALVEDPLVRVDRRAERGRPAAQYVHDLTQGPEGVHRRRPAPRRGDATDGAAAQVRTRIVAQVLGVVERILHQAGDAAVIAR